MAFLMAPQKEILYGGAAGGGKSEAGLAAFAQYADIPGYKGGVFRRTYADLKKPGSLISRSKEWWQNTDARYSSQDHAWYFPSGAVLQFGYLEHEDDKYRYQSSEYHFIFFDELTQFSKTQYVYLIGRTRRLTRETMLEKYGIDMEIPLRIRSASNPGGIGHAWVKERFIGTRSKPVRHPNRLYIPATLEDNPSLDQESYHENLMELDPITRAQLRYGDWESDLAGNKFQEDWFVKHESVPHNQRFQTIIRYWDTAATEPRKGEDPDFTVGTLYALDFNNEFWVLDVCRFRGTPAENEERILAIARRDGVGVEVWMEQEPGASGKHMIDHYRRNVLYGFAFYGLRTTGQKEVRANPVSSAAEGRNIHVVFGEWNDAWFDELRIYPKGSHDDQIDSLSGAHYILTRKMKRLRGRKARQGFGY
jgi:predicted phage terminase large subunit-like protein